MSKLFRKMDEMEMSINLKAIKYSWFFTAVVLFLWGVYQTVRNQTPSGASMVLIAQMAVYLLAVRILRIGIDEKGHKRSLIYAALLVVFLLVFGALLYFIR